MLENQNLPKLKQLNSVNSVLNSDSISPQKLYIEIKRLQPRILQLQNQAKEILQQIPPDLLTSFNEIQNQIQILTNNYEFENQKDMISFKLFNFKSKFLNKIHNLKQEGSLRIERRLQSILHENEEENSFNKNGYPFQKAFSSIESLQQQIMNHQRKINSKLNDIELMISQRQAISPSRVSKSTQIGRLLHSTNKMKAEIFSFQVKTDFFEKEIKQMQPIFGILTDGENKTDQNSIISIASSIPRLDEKLQHLKNDIKGTKRMILNEFDAIEVMVSNAEAMIDQKEQEISELTNRMNDLNEMSFNLKQRAEELLNFVQKESKTYTQDDQKQDIQHVYMMYSANQSLTMDELKYIEKTMDEDFTSYMKYNV